VRNIVKSVSALARAVLKTCVAVSLAGSMVASAEAKAPNPKFAAIVIDANTGKTLYSQDADAPRYPASLTKMMTLYLVFEALSSGKIDKSTLVPITQRAASMAPTKLGAPVGSSITIETAILGLVTKSANDAACATGEFLGGSEDRFAQMMTAKARQLGMRNTTFRNASGLPNPGQVTTAHDMAILGMALREHFPKYYGYFSTRSFQYGRSRLANHNKLLGRVAGVDGIKTGYTAKSGYNLVSSVSMDGKKLITVVLGGTSGGSRDAQVTQLIGKFLPRASGRSDGPMVALAKIFKGKKEDAADTAAQTAYAEPEAGATAEEVDPVIVAAIPAKKPHQVVVPLTSEEDGSATEVDPQTTAAVAAEPEPTGNGVWVIQIAAADSEAGAMKILDGAKAKGGKALSYATPFTQEVQKGTATLYRARFKGFDTKVAAWNACKALKKSNIGCYALNN
jgi:D-alanyl-D-alanine carboxypeptidase